MVRVLAAKESSEKRLQGQGSRYSILTGDVHRGHRPASASISCSKQRVMELSYTSRIIYIVVEEFGAKSE